jgi:hypothetical protein
MKSQGSTLDPMVPRRFAQHAPMVLSNGQHIPRYLPRLAKTRRRSMESWTLPATKQLDKKTSQEMGGNTKLSASYLQAKFTFRDMPCSLDSAPLFLKCQPICVTEATEVDQKLLGLVVF